MVQGPFSSGILILKIVTDPSELNYIGGRFRVLQPGV
jgi:hypothetical protein